MGCDPRGFLRKEQKSVTPHRKISRKKTRIFVSVTGALCVAFASGACFAQETPPVRPSFSQGNAGETAPAEKKSSEDSKYRDFYDVLEDVVADFEYDLRSGQVSGLKDLSLRNIAVSENVPPSFKSHLDLMVTERILKNTKTRIIQCLPCRSKQATLSGQNLVVTSADSNPAELARIANRSGIMHFMDVAFSYMPTGLILSLYITEAESGSVIWSRSYNSETSRAAAFRRGVDYAQVDEARRAEEYEPTLMYKPTIYYFYEKNISSYTGTLGLGFRMMERYDNRKKEVGFEVNYLLETASLVGGTDPSQTSLYSGFNITLLFVHAWNLIGNLENYNKVRGNVFAAVGGTYASGFVGGLVRGGYEWRLGKHWGVSANLGYRPQATVFISGSEAGTVSGLEFGLGISAMF